MPTAAYTLGSVSTDVYTLVIVEGDTRVHGGLLEICKGFFPVLKKEEEKTRGGALSSLSRALSAFWRRAKLQQKEVVRRVGSYLFYIRGSYSVPIC